MLAALAGRVDESLHPFLVKREVRTRGILLITTDMGLCGGLNANLFKLVLEVKTPAKFVAIGRKGTQFLSRTKRDLIADFSIKDTVPFNDVKTVVEFMMKLYLEGTIDTLEVISSCGTCANRRTAPASRKNSPTTATCCSSPARSRCSRRCFPFTSIATFTSSC
jgi:ATP synthase F1 gamma subunit